jgi:hypothetical protein
MAFVTLRVQVNVEGSFPPPSDLYQYSAASAPPVPVTSFLIDVHPLGTPLMVPEVVLGENSARHMSLGATPEGKFRVMLLIAVD